MSDNNVSDGPIPFFSSDNNQASFLSGTNITDNTQPIQPAQPAQPTQNTEQKKSTNTTAQSCQDVSSLFGNNKEESFLSSFGVPDSTNNNANNSNSNNNNNNDTNVTTLPNSNSLYYNQVNNGSTTSLKSLTNQPPYNNGQYIQKSDSNPQSIHSSSSYTNLSGYNQTNDTTYNTTATTGYTNANAIPNKSPYISSQEPNSYNSSGTTTTNYNQGFYANIANQNSTSNLSNYAKNYATTGSNSSLNSFSSPQKTQAYPQTQTNYSNTTTATNANYSNYQASYPSYTNTNNYLSTTSTNSAGTTNPSTTPYNKNTTVGNNYINSNTQTGTSTPVSMGYSSGNTNSTPNLYSTQANTTTSISNQTNSTAGSGYVTQSNTYGTYTNKVDSNGLNPSTSYSSLNTLQPNYNTNTNTGTSAGATTSNINTSTGTTNTQPTSQTTSFTNFANGSTSQLNYYNNSTNANATNSTSATVQNLTGLNDSTNQYASSIRSNTPGANSINDLQLDSSTSNQATTYKSYSSTSPNTGSVATSYINSAASLNEPFTNNTTATANVTATATTTASTTTAAIPSTTTITAATATSVPTTSNINNSTITTSTFPSMYYQNKNSQGFYSNAATSNSSPCLNSLNMSYSSNTLPARKNSFSDGVTGKHVKSNSVVSPGSTYQNPVYANTMDPNSSGTVDNAVFTGSLTNKNELQGSSLYYHDDNNGKFRSPTAPPSSDNGSKLSPSSPNTNLSRPPSVPPNYVSYNYGSTANNTTNTTANTNATTTTWQPTTTSNLTYSSYSTPAASTSTSMNTNMNSTTYPTSTTPNPYPTSTTPNPYPTSTTPNPYPTSTTPNPYPTSTTPNPYPTSTTPNPYPTSTTPNPYQTSTTPNPYQTSTTPNPYYGTTSVDASNSQNFYNFDNQSQGEIHSCDPIVMHQNLSPIVTFGFGGRLVVMFPKDLSGYGGNTIGPNTVHIKPISKFVYPEIIKSNKEHEGPILGQKKNKKQILEMLSKKINKLQNENSHYSSYSSLNTTDSDEVLILKVIQLYIENDGVIYGQNSKPEAIQSLRNLLYSAENNTSIGTTHTMINGPSVNSSEIENIKSCLLQGDRPGACKIAVNNKLWAHALIISSYINKETYKDVVNSFIKSELKGENESQRSSFQSIKVLYSLFAGMGKDAILDGSSIVNSTLPMNMSSLTNPLSTTIAAQPISLPPPNASTTTTTTTNTSDIISKWKEILSMILSNRTPNDVSAIISLGDTLLNAGKLYAAHLCYLFSPSSISGLNGKSTKAVLLGVDQNKNKKFYKNLNAFEMTEFLEYMHYLANKNLSTMPHFQAYKLNYASWLSEIGLVSQAFNYTQCILQIVKSGTTNTANGSMTSPYYNPTFFEILKEFSSRCQGHLSGTKNAPKDGWFSKITKFDTFLEAFDHGLNKFIGTTENENKIPNLSNTNTNTNTNTNINLSQSQTTNPVPNPVAMIPTSNFNNSGIKGSSSYQNLNQPYFKTSYSTDNISSIQSSRENSLSNSSKTENQKGVFSLIGNLFNKNGGGSNNSSNNSLNQDDMNNKNSYYDSITKQWVTTNPQSNEKFGNDISAPPPVASDSYYNSGYNNNSMMNNTSTTNTLSNGVIPQFGTMNTSGGISNTRRNNRTPYNMNYSNTTGQATQNTTVPPPLYSNTNNSTLDNQNNSGYNGYSWNGYGN